jgi:hypothetical protein
LSAEDGGDYLAQQMPNEKKLFAAGGLVDDGG